MKRSQNIVSDACSCLDKINNANYNDNNNRVKPTLESLFENFALNKQDVLHLSPLVSNIL